ncbi:MAG: hypothetical protein R3300_17080 [Candidatus Promineifilaceae bacterium]|nr:hypothetical protein [Candidatus Promineifilaceae bacterium]
MSDGQTFAGDANRLNVQRLFAMLMVMALFVIALRETVDPDLWWHLRTGEQILNVGIPRQDIYSFTVPDHPWVTHEWLSEVLLWIVYAGGGLPGLMLAFAGIVALAFVLVYKRCAGRPYLAGFVTILAAITAAPFAGARPQMLNLLFAAVFVNLLEGFRQGALERRWLWLLPLFTIIWANLHSGYLIGVTLILVYAIGGQLDRLTGEAGQGLSRADPVLLLGLAALSLLAAVFNPNGATLWSYPLVTLGSEAMQQQIFEWQSPNFHLRIFQPFAGLLAVGVGGLILSRKRPPWTDLILFGGLAGAALFSRRHIPLFAIVTLPIITRSLLSSLGGTSWYPLAAGRATNRKMNKDGFLRRLNWLLLVLALGAASIYTAQRLAGNDEVIAEFFPVAAVEYLEESGLARQRGFNHYAWGGYLIWHGIQVYTDGRADVYGDDFLWELRDIETLDQGWQEPLHRYDVDYVLTRASSTLAGGLLLSDQWDEVYRDDLAVIFVNTESVTVDPHRVGEKVVSAVSR